MERTVHATCAATSPLCAAAAQTRMGGKGTPILERGARDGTRTLYAINVSDGNTPLNVHTRTRRLINIHHITGFPVVLVTK